MLRPEDQGMELKPWVDTDYLNPGYLLRSLDRLPRRGDTPEWQHSQDYFYESEAIPAIDLTDPVFAYNYRPMQREAVGMGHHETMRKAG